VRRRVSPEGESYRGLQTVRIDQIVGSMDRFQDFDRTYFPRKRFTAGRWQNVDRSYYQDVRLPPIQLYKVGDVYFVKDGNHRVSVAREKGQEFIDAEVIEGHIRVPFYASMAPDELLLQAEYAEFLRRTDLDRLHPEHDIRPTALGRYDEIWQHIEGHRCWLEAIRHGPVTVHDAVEDWYEYIYRPIVQVARERGPSRTVSRTGRRRTSTSGWCATAGSWSGNSATTSVPRPRPSTTPITSARRLPGGPRSIVSDPGGLSGGARRSRSAIESGSSAPTRSPRFARGCWRRYLPNPLKPPYSAKTDRPRAI
jgi:hypothetical protein